MSLIIAISCLEAKTSSELVRSSAMILVAPTVLLIGNKFDLKDEGIPICNQEDDQTLADYIHQKLNDSSIQVNTIRTSAKTGFNIEQSFEILGKEIYFNITGEK